MAKSRKQWNDTEHAAFIQCLKDSVAKGWKTDNGFRTGHHAYLEQQMNLALPGTTIKADPHIDSKLHTWKKRYGFLHSLLSKSGVGWNAQSHTVDCSPEIWDEATKADPSMRNKRHSSWPFYEDWKVIFGKDRAHGEDDIDFSDAVNEVLKKNDDIGVTADNDGDDNMEFADDGTTMNKGTMKDAASVTVGTTTSSRKRRRASGGEDRFLELISDFIDKADAHLGSMCNVFGTDLDDKNARKMVFDALGPFPELNMKMKVEVGKVLANDSKALDFFFTLPHEGRLEFIEGILSKFDSSM